MIKQTLSHLTRALALLGALTFWNCESGTGAGNPGPSQIVLRLAAKDASTGADSSLVFSDRQGTVFRIHEALAHVRHIRFDLPDSAGCGTLPLTAPVSCDSDRVSVEGPFLMDLVGGTSLPDLGRIGVPAGVYSRIDVRLSEADGNGNPVPAGHTLAGRTLLLKAVFSYQGRSDRRLDLALKFTEDMRFESDGGLRLLPTTAYAVIMGLRVDQWFKNVDITRCLDNGDLELDAAGNLSISDRDGKGSCAGVESTIKENLKNSGDLTALPLEG